MIDINNTVLKSIVTTLQGQVDVLKAENEALRQDFTSPFAATGGWKANLVGSSIPGTDEDWNLYWKSEGALPGADDFWMSNELRGLDRENIVLQSDVMKLQVRIDDLEREKTALNTDIDLRETVEHNTAHLWKQRDKLVEENKKLLKDNTKLATKIRTIESGNFDEFFTYTTSPVQLAPLGTAVMTITLTREADFYITKIVRENTGPFAFLVRDSSNDRQWSNIPLHSNLGAGTAEMPLILPKPRFVARASTLTIEVTDISMMANEVRLAFIGYKVYHVEALYSTAE